MSNKHLFPAVSVLLCVVVLVILSVNPIPISPIMISTIVMATFLAGFIYHETKKSLTNGKVVELALLAFIVQIAAISFL